MNCFVFTKMLLEVEIQQVWVCKIGFIVVCIVVFMNPCCLMAIIKVPKITEMVNEGSDILDISEHF